MKRSKVIAIERLITGEYAFVRFFDGGGKTYGAFTPVTIATRKRIVRLIAKYKTDQYQSRPMYSPASIVYEF